MRKLTRATSFQLFAVALAWVAPSGHASAEADFCTPVAQLMSDFAAQELFYWDPDTKTWAAVPDGGLSLSGREAQLIYVTREFFQDEPRSGAIVVKTGRKIDTSEKDPEPARKKIKLDRAKQAEFDSCRGREPSSFDGRVSALEYDRYHDYGYDASDNEDGRSLGEFHTRYVSRSGRCDAATDSTTFDAPLRWDWRSNRSQFSFDPSVVSGGFHSQIMAGLSIRGAAAVGSVGLADQRVDIIKYRTNAQKMACIALRVKPTGRNFFIRVNDLEGAPKGGRLIRADELSRQLTR
ncbi:MULTISPECIES: hypothetical protein [unclassified Bradyrhizobium]|uniref:hypothetical protein n=1 Tax=unclassified Bradyrhizobium TaxID=2631580 RepID=UPI0028E78AD5|nr:MULTISPECIES: hypothetical protein [unclassified Bradyrhizobium]